MQWQIQLRILLSLTCSKREILSTNRSHGRMLMLILQASLHASLLPGISRRSPNLVPASRPTMRWYLRKSKATASTYNQNIVSAQTGTRISSASAQVDRTITSRMPYEHGRVVRCLGLALRCLGLASFARLSVACRHACNSISNN